ncbi:MAG: LysR family transcriptional regulator [Clostridia bacterium]|nr:LysR family transcriptional regulator [Clostridia bacterium]
MRSITNPAKYSVLAVVAETGSLTAAAEKLGYTQSGISRIIQDIEAECGFPLIMRGKSGSSLTRDGEKLIGPIRQLMRAEEQLSGAVDEIKGLRSGKVRVGMFSSVAVHWAPELIERFTAQYPSIEVELFSGLYDEIEDRVLDERLDCGFSTKQTKRDLNFVELTRDRLLAVVPKDHPFAAFDRLPAELIEKADLILPGEGSGYDIGAIFRSCRITPRVKYALSDDYAALSMVERGLGITILPELILEGRAGNYRVLELEPAFHRTIGIVSRPRRGVSPAAKAFIDFVKAFVRAMRESGPEKYIK